MTDNSGWSDRLQCFVARIGYDYQTKQGRIHMLTSDGCTDMGGAVAMFEAIDPDAQVIRTYRNGGHMRVADTFYVKGPTGWQARMPQTKGEKL